MSPAVRTALPPSRLRRLRYHLWAWVRRTYIRYVEGPTHPRSSLTALPVTTVRWIWSGAQTATSFTVNARLAHDSAAVYLAVSRSSDMAAPLRYGPVAAHRRLNNRVVSITADGLAPDTSYYYAIQADGVLDRSRQGHARTFPTGAGAFTLAVGTCAMTGSNGRVFDTIREWPRLLEPLRLLDDPPGLTQPGTAPVFYLQTGDLHYEDVSINDPNAYRTAFERVLAAPAQAALYRAMPIVYLWDDHDFGRNDEDRTAPGRDAAQRVYRQYVPHHPLPAGTVRGPIHRAFTAGRVRFILTDTRSEKSPVAEPDTAEKTMLGPAQKAWFKRELLNARDTHALIVWVCSVPWIGAPDPSCDFWGGFATERRELADFIAEHHVHNLLMISGDAHMVAIDDGRNSDYATDGGARFPVFHAAALDRKGNTKGGPYSHGARTGGGHFGLVTVEDTGGATITVTLTARDYRGEAIVSHTFQVAASRR